MAITAGRFNPISGHFGSKFRPRDCVVLNLHHLFGHDAAQFQLRHVACGDLPRMREIVVEKRGKNAEEFTG